MTIIISWTYQMIVARNSLTKLRLLSLRLQEKSKPVCYDDLSF